MTAHAEGETGGGEDEESRQEEFDDFEIDEELIRQVEEAMRMQLGTAFAMWSGFFHLWGSFVNEWISSRRDKTLQFLRDLNTMDPDLTAEERADLVATAALDQFRDLQKDIYTASVRATGLSATYATKLASEFRGDDG